MTPSQVVVDTAPIFGANNQDYLIQVHIPDVYIGFAGDQGFIEGTYVILIITPEADIKAPTYSGEYETSYALMGGTGADDVLGTTVMRIPAQ